MPALRILVVHNAYRHRGGEDSVVEAESAMLRERGHAVELLVRDNAEIAAMDRVRLAAETVWSSRTAAAITTCVARFRPQLIHAHNTFPLVSASLYWAAARAGVPVVQTLHNFRLLCPQAMFLREARVCEDCLGRLPWRGVIRRCYRGSLTQSGVLATMLAVHRGLGSYERKVARYIALNEFCRRKFVEGGLPAGRVVVKPNFVDIPAATESAREGGLFVGRLAQEKGIEVLAGAAARRAGLRITVAGSGPLEARVRGVAGLLPVGALAFDDIVALMRRSCFLVLPSLWYENFPRTIVEAFACGLPVIASRIGALAELVEDGRTGLLFEVGSAEDLAAKIAWAAANPAEMRRMGAHARAEYEARYTPARNYDQLIGIYREAIELGAGGGAGA